MANDMRRIKGMEDIVTCSICYDLYKDARTLTCQHCFCLKCLMDYQTFAVVKHCPICRAETVPAVRDLHRLPPNRALNEMVGLMAKLRGGSQSNGNQQSTAQPATNAQRHNFPPPQYTPNERNQPPANQPTVRRTHMPPSETSQTTAAPRPQNSSSSSSNEVLSGSLNGDRMRETELSSYRIRELERLSFSAVWTRETEQEERAEVSAEALAEAFAGVVLSGMVSSGDAHKGVQCDECHTMNFSGVRYKCGVCADYDLCERCERKPRTLVHDMKHLFVKLRRPATCQVARGQILHPVGYSIGQQMCFNSNIHTLIVSVNQHGQSLMMTGTINCDRCGENPIRGTRFKCGICDDYDLCASCESDSPSFHPRNHVFLVIPHPSNAPQTKGRLLRVNFY